MSDEGTNVDEPAAKPARAGRKDDVLHLIRSNLLNFGVLAGVWSLGYYHFSWSWLCLVGIGMLWRERQHQRKLQRMLVARHATQNEREVVMAAVRELPSWVYFPDTERAEWLNKMVKQLWPYIEGYVEQLLRDTVEPAVQGALPSYLKSFKFEKIKLGQYPPRIGGVKVYTDEVGRDEIILDLELFYAGDCDIEMSVKTLKRIKAGIESLQLHGTLRVVMKPLVKKVPLVGGLQIYFLNRPAIDFNLTNLADVLDFPGLSNLLHTILDDQLSYFLVLPNRIPISLIDSVEMDLLKYPMPQGVLRICVVECKNLIKADIGLMKKGKSDPYVVCQVGAQQYKTKILQNELNPVFNEYFEAIVYEADGQTLDIDVFDEDKGTKDDFIGCVSLDINLFAKQGYVDSWLPLQEIKHGDIHLQLQWMHLTESMKGIEERLAESLKLKCDTDSSRTHSCLLVVKLDSAKHLPASKRSAALPDVFCELKVSNHKETSQIKHQTTSPIWEEAYHFLVQNPKLQSLDVEVKDKKKNKTLGTLTIPLKRLLTQPKMALDQKFKLEQSGSHSELLMKLCLRALDKAAANTTSVDGNKLVAPEMSKNVNLGYNMSVSRKADDEEDDDIDGGLEDSFGSGPGSPVDSIPPPQSAVLQEASSPVQKESQSPTTKEPSQPNSPTIISSDEDQEMALNGTELRKRLSKQQKEQDLVFGKIQLTIRYSSPRNRLIVVIHKAEELLKEEDGDPPDPYVRLYLKPDKSKSGRRKTKEFKKTCSPTFDETFEFVCSAEEIEQRSLSLAVKNSSSSFLSLSSKLLGQCEISMDTLDLTKATTEWYTLKGDQGDNISSWSNK
ncbi:extended synaptotagmin-2-like isoform X3 [Amphiura filiformis]|uniref:extended synaptotagmin-2-like isoform X3 n=1 Tax=Amphiura filiformis TaxID=82378 RepID=UPI003B21F132